MARNHKSMGTEPAAEANSTDDGPPGLADGGYRWINCADCGNAYPVGGDKLESPVESSPESAEHHAEDCPIRDELERRGQTADRSVHVERPRDGDQA